MAQPVAQSASTAGEVFWGEGMFLRPHHFQAAERHRDEALRREVRCVQPFAWGLTRLELAEEQLANFVFDLRALEGRLPDGTLVRLGSTLHVAPRGFKAELARAPEGLTVYLGVPSRQEGAPVVQIGDPLPGHPRRYVAEAVEMLDENLGGNPQWVSVRRLQGRLLFGSDRREGFDCLPLARVRRAAGGRNLPELCPDYVPPASDVGASPALQRLCDGVVHALEARQRVLLGDLAQGRFSLDAEGAAGWQAFAKLQVLAGFLGVLGQLARLPRVAPLAAYLELCRLAGELSVFGDLAGPLDLPHYDHEDLGGCFGRVTGAIHDLLERVVASRFVRVELARQEDLLVAELRPEWGGPIFLALETGLDQAAVAARLGTVKMGAPGAIATLRERRLHGLDRTLLKRVPAGLPARDDMFYCALAREGPEWAAAARERRLALWGAQDVPWKACLYVATAVAGGAA